MMIVSCNFGVNCLYIFLLISKVQIKITQKKKLVYNSQVLECYEMQRKYKYFSLFAKFDKSFSFKVKLLKVHY